MDPLLRPEYLRLFLVLASLTTYPDDALCAIYDASLNIACRAPSSEDGPRANFAAFVEWTLARNGSPFPACSQENLASATPNPVPSPPSLCCAERMPEPTAHGEPEPAATDEPSPHWATEPELQMTSVKAREPATTPALRENSMDVWAWRGAPPPAQRLRVGWVWRVDCAKARENVLQFPSLAHGGLLCLLPESILQSPAGPAPVPEISPGSLEAHKCPVLVCPWLSSLPVLYVSPLDIKDSSFVNSSSPLSLLRASVWFVTICLGFLFCIVLASLCLPVFFFVFFINLFCPGFFLFFFNQLVLAIFVLSLFKSIFVLVHIFTNFFILFWLVFVSFY